MSTDIYIKLNGFWYETKVYRDVKNQSIDYTDDFYIQIEFTRIVKGKKREYNLVIPKTNISFIGVMINE